MLLPYSHAQLLWALQELQAQAKSLKLLSVYSPSHCAWGRHPEALV